MAIEPEYGLSVLIQSVRVAIAATGAWQSWTRADQKPLEDRLATAMKRIHLFGFPPPASPADGYTRDELDLLRPGCGLTYIPPQDLRTTLPGFELTRTAAEHFIEYGRVYVHVADTVDPSITHDSAKVLMSFSNKLGRLMYDLPTTSDVEGAAYFQKISLVVEPHRATKVQENTQGDFVQAMLRVECGLRGDY